MTDRPFGSICADYFHHAGSCYLVVVDRYSGWPIVSQATGGAAGLAATLREVFGSFGIPDTITTDGGPEFTAHSTAEFLDSWGVQHRICSAYTPHSNNRAETGVKSMKRLIAGNTGPGGALKTSFYRALLTYRNSPCPDTSRVSPAMCVLGRATRDLIPTLPSRLQPPTNPSENKRQAALQRRQALANARWQEHSVGLSPLRCSDRVHVQNQHGNHPTKWDQGGTITEVLQYHQYVVKMTSSGRHTTRNRRHLRLDHLPPTRQPVDAWPMLNKGSSNNPPITPQPR